MSQATLGGIKFTTDPEQIRWNFQVKTARHRTIGGQVIQIIGCTVSDMTVSGRFGAKVPSDAWQEYDALRNRVKGWVRALQSDTTLAPIRFTYAPRGWDFAVYVKALDPITHDNKDPAPQFRLTLFMAGENNKIAKGVKDIYMARLMDGIGWQQTEYNGPTQSEVDALLNGMTMAEYLATQDQAAFEAGLQGQFGTANN